MTTNYEFLDNDEIVLGNGPIIYVTETVAIDPKDVKLKKWSGPLVRGINATDAQRWVTRNLGGYLEVVGELKGIVPLEGEGLEGLKQYNRHQDN